jgi:hypothetical protein
MSKDMTGLSDELEYGVEDLIICVIAMVFLLFWLLFIVAVICLAVARVAARLF